MEEADAICDRLMIMADGEMECIGVSADLKHRFGSGFKLSMQVSKGQSAEPAHNFVNKLIPGITLMNELAGTRNYQVPKVLSYILYLSLICNLKYSGCNHIGNCI